MSDFDFGPAVATARATASHRQLRLGVGHAQEILASLFGFNTYAAFIMELAMTPEDHGLRAAEHFILNPKRGSQRCQALNLPDDLVACCLIGAQESLQRSAFTSVSDFWREIGRQDLIARINDDEYFSNQMGALSHVNYEEDGFEVDAQSGNFWKAREEWSILTSGEMQGTIEDEDGDDFQIEETIKIWGRAVYLKAGRAGLVLSHIDLSPSPDHW